MRSIEGQGRLNELWRWMTLPWRSTGLAIALIASFAAPSLMAASADLFRASAADTITQQLLAESAAELGMTVIASGTPTQQNLDAIDAALGGRIDDVPLLGKPVRTVVVRQVGLVGRVADDTVSPLIGSSGTLFQRAGAIDSLRVIAGDRSVEGLWVSEQVAERFGLSVGDDVTVTASKRVPIAGIYANLWDGEPDPYWNTVPPTLVPRYINALGGPTLELYVVPESVMYELGLPGEVRWDAPLDLPPRSYKSLVGLAFLYRDVEHSYTQSPTVSQALDEFSGVGAAVPTLQTGLFDLERQAGEIVNDLEQPIQTTSVAGIVIGLLTTAAGAAFAVRKRQNEFRVLRSDGDPGWRFAVRAVGQYAPFAMIGAIVGLAMAVALVEGFGPAASVDVGVIDLGQVAVTVVGGLLLAAFVTSASAVRILDRSKVDAGTLRLALLLPIVGLAIAGWVQVGSASRQRDVDLLVVAFPLVGLTAGVGVITLVTRAVMARARRTGGSLPTAFFLAWRRITAAEAGAVLLSVALGIAVGLMLFSTVLVGSLEAASDAKAITVAGGQTSIRMVSRDEFPLPQTTTLIKRQTLRLSVGDTTVRVLVLDPDTFADAVSWDPLFGDEPSDVLAELQRTVGADVAALAVGDVPVPVLGAFGTSTVLTYEIVGRLNSMPLASHVDPTLVVRSDALEGAARRVHGLAQPPDLDAAAWADLYRSPTRGFVHVLVSQLGAGQLTQDLDARGLDYRDVVTLADQRVVVANRATQWTFEYLWLLAIVAAVAGGGTLLFYLSERRTTVQLSETMLERMGLAAGTARAAVIIEMAGLMVFTLAAGSATGLLLAARTFGRFEPDPRIPPRVGLQYSVPVLAGVAAGALVAIIAAALWSQRAASRQSYGEVLRGA